MPEKAEGDEAVLRDEPSGKKRGNSGAQTGQRACGLSFFVHPCPGMVSIEAMKTHLNPLGSPQTCDSTKGRGEGAHPGLDSFPTSHAECSVIVEVSALPMALFSFTMIT